MTILKVGLSVYKEVEIEVSIETINYCKYIESKSGDISPESLEEGNFSREEYLIATEEIESKLKIEIGQEELLISNWTSI